MVPLALRMRRTVPSAKRSKGLGHLSHELFKGACPDPTGVRLLDSDDSAEPRSPGSTCSTRASTSGARARRRSPASPAFTDRATTACASTRACSASESGAPDQRRRERLVVGATRSSRGSVTRSHDRVGKNIQDSATPAGFEPVFGPNRFADLQSSVEKLRVPLGSVGIA